MGTIQNPAIQGFKNQKSWYMFLCAHNDMFAYTIVHLKQFFMHKCMLMCTSPCPYYKDKVNVRSIPLTINQEPSLGIQTSFHKERNNRQVSCLPRTKRLCRNGDFAQVTQMASNNHIMVKIFTIFYNLSAVLSYIEMFSYNNMADGCVNKWLEVTAKVSGESLLTLYQ